MKILTLRVNAIITVGSSADFKKQKMIVNAIVMSRILNLIQVYDNASTW